MNEFLEYLAERKYMYYHYFHTTKPQAYTSIDCYERIQKDARYHEILTIIDCLSLEQKRVVDKRFDELKRC